MALRIVQTAGVATVANSPTSITVTTTATQVGTCLLLVVALEGTGTPGITTPANWTLQSTSGGATQQLAVFSRPNNPGAITSVVVALTGTTYGACAELLEISDSNPPVIEAIDSGGATGANFPATITGPQTTPGILYYGEFWLLALALNSAQTITGAFTSAGWTIADGERVSTNGTANIRLDVYYNYVTYQSIGLTAGGLALSGATDRSGALLRLISSSAQALVVSGEPASMMSQGYSGALGGL